MGPRWEHLECSLFLRLENCPGSEPPDALLVRVHHHVQGKLVIEKGYVELKLGVGINFLS